MDDAIDKDRVHEMVEELTELEPGWDGEDAPISMEAIVLAYKVVTECLPFAIPMPKVVPMARGNLQFEWYSDGVGLELEIEPPGVHILKVWDEGECMEEIIGDLDAAEEAATWFIVEADPWVQQARASN